MRPPEEAIPVRRPVVTPYRGQDEATAIGLPEVEVTAQGVTPTAAQRDLLESSQTPVFDSSLIETGEPTWWDKYYDKKQYFKARRREERLRRKGKI